VDSGWRGAYHDFLKHAHEGRKPAPNRRADPVPVYLDPADRERLERLTERLGATKSDVLRQGRAPLEAQSQRFRGVESVAQLLPTVAGQGLQPGVDLDDTAGLLDLMDAGGATG